MAFARFQRTIVDASGNIVASPTISVRDQATNGLVTIYSDRDGLSALSNPFTGTVDGLAAFHVAGGAYKITATSGAYTAEWTWVGIGTASERDFDELTTYVDDAIEAAVPSPFPVNKGGTGRTSLTAENILIGDGTSAVKFVAPGSSGQVLTSNGTIWASSDLPQQITATTGSPPYYGARAWVNFDGTLTSGNIRASANVSSVTRNATGNYTVSFSTAMPDANYAICASSGDTTSFGGQTIAMTPAFYATGSCRVFTGNDDGAITAQNSTFVNVAIFR